MDSFGQMLPLIGFAALIGLGAVLWPLRAFLRGGGGGARAKALAAALATVACAFGVYLSAGKPAMADNPFAARIAALEAIANDTPQALDNEQMLAILAARARRSPKEPQPHFFSGMIYASEGRFDEAARAYDAALRRDPANAATMIELGAAMVAMDGRIVSPEALALFQEAGRLRPDDVRPVFYQALAASQNGRKADALQLWPRVLSMLAPDDPRRQMANMMLEQARS